MEELWENHQNAVKNKFDTEFKFVDFYNVGLLSQYLKKIAVEGLSEKIVEEYENETQNYKLKIIWLSLLKKGLIESQKPNRHEWMKS